MESTQAHNVQPGHVIERTDGAYPQYFCLKIGRDFGQPAGAWVSEIEQADIMSNIEASDRLATSLASIAPFCKVVPR